MLIGLDCAEPSLVLERWRGELPTLAGLMERGRYGRLRSVVPPITVPAWSCMMASRTPGDLGVYGFRNRADHSYDNLVVADGSAIKAPRLWDLATRYGKPSIVLGVPGTYPPRPLNGVLVSCFLTPSLESGYTYPPLLAREIEQVVGEYLFDCTNFRTDDKDDLLRQVYEMTDKRFRLAEHLLETKPWALFAMVEIGLDRMHHGFWKDLDERHHRHDPAGEHGDAILDYHRHLDSLLARLLAHADEETAVLVVSDHGAKRMEGGIRINEWLRREGLLETLGEPNGITSLRDAGVDWARTTAWGEGGYYAPHLPQRARPRARGHRRAGGGSSVCATSSRSGWPRSPARTARRWRRRSTGPRRSTRRSTGSLPTCSSTSTTSPGAPSAPSAGTRGSTPSRTTPGRMTQTTRKTAC